MSNVRLGKQKILDLLAIAIIIIAASLSVNAIEDDGVNIGMPAFSNNYNSPVGIDIFWVSFVILSSMILLSPSIWKLFGKNRNPLGISEGRKLHNPNRYKLLNLTKILFSPKVQKEVFEATIADWDEEDFQALSKKEIWKSRWINLRYTYAFLLAMWMKSPIGDLIEFIRKFAK